MRNPRPSLLAFAILAIGGIAQAQITLTGTAYTESFANLGTALPAGWSVYTGALATTYGTAAAFTNGSMTWANSTAGTFFRNVAGNDISTGANSATQNADLNRGLGWKPLNAASRDGSIVFELTNTTGFQNFNLSVDLFTANNAGALNQTYILDYRLGTSGAFTTLGTYTTTTPFGTTTLTANSITLSALNNQSSLVAFRFRNSNTTADTTYDTLVIDNFNLTFAAVAIPEPSTCATLLGGVALAGVMIRRRRPRPAA